MAELCIMDRTGDTKIVWDASKPDEVATARAAFDAAKAKRMVAYSVDPSDGSKGEIVRTFDPNASKIILAAPLAGG